MKFLICTLLVAVYKNACSSQMPMEHVWGQFYIFSGILLLVVPTLLSGLVLKPHV